MWNKEECEVAKSYYTKVSGLRADVHTKDWADDKRLSLGSYGGYGYLSMDKIVKQIAPLFNKHGLEIELRYYDLQQSPTITNDNDKYHWTVCLDVTLIDIDTGYKGQPVTTMGESADRGDKGVTKAMTSAYKNWHIKFFDLADGIDPDSDSVEAQDARKFARSEAEKEEVTSKVLAAAKSSVESDRAPATAPKQVRDKILQQLRTDKTSPAETEEPAPAEESAPSEPEPVTETKDEPAEEPVAAPEAATKPKFVPKAPQKKAIDGILKSWDELATNGKVAASEYNEMSAAYLDINSDAAAVAFIRKYRRSV